MIEIIPAIMPSDMSDLQKKMALVTGFVPLVQVDVMDGAFVPNKTWPYKNRPDTDFEKIIKEEGGFPLWEELDFEADLMVADAVAVAQDWISAGATRLIVHLDSISGAGSGAANTDVTNADRTAHKVLEKIRAMLPTDDSILYTEIGLAVRPGTPLEKIEPHLDIVDFVQFMGIEKVGFQKQPFQSSIIDTITRLRAAHPNGTISVDGGVNLETAPKLIAAGVDRLVIGSAIFESEDVAVTIEKFFALADAGADADAGDTEKE